MNTIHYYKQFYLFHLTTQNGGLFFLDKNNTINNSTLSACVGIGVLPAAIVSYTTPVSTCTAQYFALRARYKENVKL